MARWAMVFMIALLATGLVAQDADDQARRIVEQPRYKGYRVERAVTPEQTAREWQEEQERRQGREGEGSGESGQDNRASFRRGGRSASPQRSSGPESSGPDDPGASGPDFSGMAWLGPVFEVIVWVVVIAAGLVALFFLVKALLGLKLQRRKKPAKSKAEKKKAATTIKPQDEPAAPEIPEEVFLDALGVALAEYDAALKAQDWSRATMLAYRIFWLRAGWAGCVENTDVRTWRDAVRLVRVPETRQKVRDLLRLIERVRYGDHAPDDAEFRQWRSELEMLDPREALK